MDRGWEVGEREVGKEDGKEKDRRY